MLRIQGKLQLLLVEFFHPEVVDIGEFIFPLLNQEQCKDLLLNEGYLIGEDEWRDLYLVQLFYVQDVVLSVEEKYQRDYDQEEENEPRTEIHINSSFILVPVEFAKYHVLFDGFY